jgi:hypothetical protein
MTARQGSVRSVIGSGFGEVTMLPPVADVPECLLSFFDAVRPMTGVRLVCPTGAPQSSTVVVATFEVPRALMSFYEVRPFVGESWEQPTNITVATTPPTMEEIVVLSGIESICPSCHQVCQ